MLEFLKKTIPYLNLPMWAVLAIALAVVILTIVVIVIAVCKQKKSKKQLAKIKLAKEDQIVADYESKYAIVSKLDLPLAPTSQAIEALPNPETYMPDMANIEEIALDKKEKLTSTKLSVEQATYVQNVVNTPAETFSGQTTQDDYTKMSVADLQELTNNEDYLNDTPLEVLQETQLSQDSELENINNQEQEQPFDNIYNQEQQSNDSVLADQNQTENTENTENVLSQEGQQEFEDIAQQQEYTAQSFSNLNIMEDEQLAVKQSSNSDDIFEEYIVVDTQEKPEEDEQVEQIACDQYSEQEQAVADADNTQEQVADSVTATQEQTIADADITQEQVADGVADNQEQAVADADNTQEPVADSVTATQEQTIADADNTQEQVADSVTATQEQVVADSVTAKQASQTDNNSSDSSQQFEEFDEENPLEEESFNEFDFDDAEPIAQPQSNYNTDYNMGANNYQPYTQSNNNAYAQQPYYTQPNAQQPNMQTNAQQPFVQPQYPNYQQSAYNNYAPRQTANAYETFERPQAYAPIPPTSYNSDSPFYPQQMPYDNSMPYYPESGYRQGSFAFPDNDKYDNGYAYYNNPYPYQAQIAYYNPNMPTVQSIQSAPAAPLTQPVYNTYANGGKFNYMDYPRNDNNYNSQSQMPNQAYMPNNELRYEQAPTTATNQAVAQQSAPNSNVKPIVQQPTSSPKATPSTSPTVPQRKPANYKLHQPTIADKSKIVIIPLTDGGVDEKRGRFRIFTDKNNNIRPYKFQLVTKNNQVLFESQGFKVKPRIQQIDAFRKVITTGAFEFNQEPNGAFRFTLLTANERMCGVGDMYKNMASAEKAALATKKFGLAANYIEDISDAQN